jgi:hypothetical protein
MNTGTKNAFVLEEAASTDVSLFDSQRSDLLSDCDEILEECERLDRHTQGIVERLVEVTSELMDSGGDLKALTARLSAAGTYFEEATRDAESTGKELCAMAVSLDEVLADVHQAASCLVCILRELIGEE